MMRKKTIALSEIVLNINDQLKIKTALHTGLSIEDICRTSTLLEFNAFNYPAESYNPTKINRHSKLHEINAKNNRIIFALNNRKPVGFVELNENTGKLFLLATLKNKQDQGTGTQLLKASIIWFHQRGYRKFKIHSTNGSFEFYKKFFERNSNINFDNKTIFFSAEHKFFKDGSAEFKIQIK